MLFRSPPPAPVAAPPPPAPEPPLPQGQKWGANNAGSRVTLLVHRPVRIIVLGPNKQTFLNRQLGPGDSYLLPNMSGLTLTTADSGAVEAIVDGATKGYVGGNGVSAEGLSLNPQDVVNRASR